MRHPTLLPLALVLGLSAACRRDPPNLLVGRLAERAAGVSSASVITNGQVLADGEAWNATGTAMFDAATGFVVYDLGESKHIGAATLQGDNNDEYVVSLSDDGQTFRELWVAGPAIGSGL